MVPTADTGMCYNSRDSREDYNHASIGCRHRFGDLGLPRSDAGPATPWNLRGVFFSVALPISLRPVSMSGARMVLVAIHHVHVGLLLQQRLSAAEQCFIVSVATLTDSCMLQWIFIGLSYQTKTNCCRSNSSAYDMHRAFMLKTVILCLGTYI